MRRSSSPRKSIAPPVAPAMGPSGRRRSLRARPKSRSRARPNRSISRPVEFTRSSPRKSRVPQKRPASGCAAAAASSDCSQPGPTSTASLINATSSAPAARARRSARLFPRAYPWLSGRRRTVTAGKSARSREAVESLEPLSTTTTSSRARASCAESARRQSGSQSAPRWVTTMPWTSGGAVCATCCACLLSVGINASPLAAPRTGVGRYIAGLLAGLEQVQDPEVRFRALFAPGAAVRSPSGIVARAFRAARAAAKRLPAAYEMAQAARGAALAAERRNGLTLYHETNHAAPPFSGPVVLTVHDLSTLVVPQTEEPARVRHFARALRLHARDAQRVVPPTEAIARQVVERLGVARDRVRAIRHGVDARFRPDGPKAKPVPGPYVLYVGALGPRKGVDTLLTAFDVLPEPLRRAHSLVLAGPLQRIDPARLE